ncbi:hypothetical protein H0W80_02130 [Candidatus Saccharibacteria bacterium]|nr:hypothetical protein [Candidatus Saccharibacteria bacterium]
MNPKNHQTPEEIAQNLKKFSQHTPSKKDLLHTTLDKINLEDVTDDQTSHYDLQSTNNTNSEGWFMDKIRVYVPLAAIAIIVVVGSLVVFRRSASAPKTVTPSTVSTDGRTIPNGTVDNAFTAVSADVSQEDIASQQLIKEGQATTSAIDQSVKSLGDISNDSSL